MEFSGKKIYCDSLAAGNDHRQGYVSGIESFIEHQNEIAKGGRTEFMPPLGFAKNPEKWRQELIAMLGINNIPKGPTPPPVITPIGEDDLCKIYSIQVYITPEIPFFALLLTPHGTAKTPLVVCQHGGGGAPELLCGFCGKNNYGFAAQRLLNLGAAVLAPQLMLWSLEEHETTRNFKVQYNRARIDTKLRTLGITLTGLEVTGIMRCINFATTIPKIDKNKIGMAGLSYGGYFTIYTMAVDKRIKAGLSAGCFNDRSKYPWQDTTYFGSALRFGDAEVAALCAPRPLYIAVGKEDTVFDYRTAPPEAERTAAYYKAFGKPQNFRFDLWDGEHRFPETDEGFKFLMKGLQNNE